MAQPVEANVAILVEEDGGDAANAKQGATRRVGAHPLGLREGFASPAGLPALRELAGEDAAGRERELHGGGRAPQDRHGDRDDQ